MVARSEAVVAEEDGNDAAGSWSLLKRVDDAIFEVEQGFVALSLSLITVMVFLDVVHRRITAPDSKVGQVIAMLFGVRDEATRAWIDGTLATPVGAVGSFLLLLFAYATARRHAGERWPFARIEARVGGRWGGAVVFTVATMLGCLAFAYGMEHLPSRVVYGAIFAVGGVILVLRALRRQERFHAVVHGVVFGGLFASSYALPDGYFWSKKVSLMLLLWVGFLGASICAHEGKHIRIEALAKIAPELSRRYVLALGFLLTALFCAVMAYLGWLYYDGLFLEGAYIGGYIEGTEIPDWLAIVAVPVTFGLTMVRYVAAAISALMGGSYGAQAEEEGLAEARELAADEADAEEAAS
jgi:TRAP-type C4-dicarboxylate transport system permease small subunit